MRLSTVLLVPGLLILCHTPRPAVAQGTASALAGLDREMAQILENWEAPGLAVAVVKDGQTILARGYGVTTLGGSDAVDEHTVFAIASTSKAFTAAALGMLVDEGRLAWDDPVHRHLPAFRLRDPWVTRELTVRDLLSHRSGLLRGDHLWYLSPFDREEVLRRAAHLPSTGGFREGYGYQNIMFVAAGEVLEEIAGTSWDRFVEDRIFTPLSMGRTSTSTRDLPGATNVATPHVRLDGAVVPIPWPDFDNVGAAGAINSSASDMARWIRAQLAHGAPDGIRLWSDSVAREMWEPNTVVRLSDETRRTHPESNLQAYALGWFLQDYRGHLVVRHGGSLDGMRAHVAMVPSMGLGVVALTNLNESRIPVAVVWEVLERYLAPESERDWNAVLLAEAERDREAGEARTEERSRERLIGTTPSRPLEAYAGRYVSELSGVVEVEFRDDALRLSYGPNYVATLEHWHHDSWDVVWRDRSQGRRRVTFHLDPDGDVGRLELSGVDTFVRR